MQICIDGGNHKIGFSTLLREIAPKEQCEEFIRFIFQTLKGKNSKTLTIFLTICLEPNLPLINLKRETWVQDTRSLFQNKLSEVLYEETVASKRKFNFLDENKALIDTLQEMQDKLSQEVFSFYLSYGFLL